MMKIDWWKLFPATIVKRAPGDGGGKHCVSTRFMGFFQVSVDICEEVYLVWTTALHMCLYNGVQDALDLGHKLQGKNIL